MDHEPADGGNDHPRPERQGRSVEEAATSARLEIRLISRRLVHRRGCPYHLQVGCGDGSGLIERQGRDACSGQGHIANDLHVPQARIDALQFRKEAGAKAGGFDFRELEGDNDPPWLIYTLIDPAEPPEDAGAPEGITIFPFQSPSAVTRAVSGSPTRAD